MADYSQLSNQELLNAYMQNKFDADLSAEIYRRRSSMPYSFSEESAPLPPAPAAPPPISASVGSSVAAPAPLQSVPGTSEAASAVQRLLESGRASQQQPTAPVLDISGIPQTIRLSGGSRTVTPGAYSMTAGEKLAKLQEQIAAQKQAEAANIENITGVSRTGEISKMVRPGPGPSGLMQPTEKTQVGYLTDWAEAHSAFKNSIAAEQAEVGKEKSKRQIQLEKAELSLQEADEKLKEAKVDPDNFYKGAKGIFRGVLGAFAMAFGAYAQGLSGGKIPNTAASIIENAINRDMEAQRANIDILLKQRGYAKETRDYVTSRLDSSLQQYKANQLRIGELDLAHKAALTKKPELILAVSKTITDLDTQAKKAEMAAILATEAAKPKVTTTGTSREVVNPLLGAALKQATQQPRPERQPPAEPGKQLREELDYIRKVDALMEEYKIAKPSRFTTQQKWNAAAAEFGKKLATVTDTYRHATTGAAFTEQERKNYEERFGPGWLTGWQPSLNLVKSLRDSAAMKAIRILQQYPQYKSTPTPEDWKSMSGTGKQLLNYIGEPQEKVPKETASEWRFKH